MSEDPTPEYIPPDDEDAGPRTPDGTDDNSHDTQLASEALKRNQWGRKLGLGFVLVFGAVTIGMIGATVCLVYKLIGTFTVKELTPTPLFQSPGALSHFVPMLPVFSISLFALLMFITLARFATDFINEERRGSSGQPGTTDDGSDDAAAIRVLRRLLAALGGK